MLDHAWVHLMPTWAQPPYRGGGMCMMLALRLSGRQEADRTSHHIGEHVASGSAHSAGLDFGEDVYVAPKTGLDPIRRLQGNPK